jgi:hypothetical protein
VHPIILYNAFFGAMLSRRLALLCRSGSLIKYHECPLWDEDYETQQTMNGRLNMNVGRDFLLFVSLAAAASPACGQTVSSSVGSADSGKPSAAPIPDFSGTWAHPSFPGFEPPASGPGPVVNKSRMRGGSQAGRSSNLEFVGDYTNPILRPQAAEIVKKRGEVELSGVVAPNPNNQCWPEPLPYIFWNPAMQMIQEKHQIIFLYSEDHEVRRVRLNEPHLAQVTPSWYGDSVGYYENGTLVIDSVGIKAVRPFAMVDWFGTPYTEALHVIERYRLLDYEAAEEGLGRDAKENFQIIGASRVRLEPNYKGKHLQLQFIVEDSGVFTIPWSATITYRRGFGEWQEMVCADNTRGFFDGKDAAVPRADKPDF